MGCCTKVSNLAAQPYLCGARLFLVKQISTQASSSVPELTRLLLAQRSQNGCFIPGSAAADVVSRDICVRRKRMPSAASEAELFFVQVRQSWVSLRI
jgi:hypothetical protein